MPPYEIVMALQTRLRDRGIELPDDLVAVVAGSFLDFAQSPTGVQYLSVMLGMRWNAGSELNEYRFRDGYGNQQEEINADEIGFVEGIFYKGQPITPAQVVVQPKSMRDCDDCRVKTHCPKEVWDNVNKTWKQLCNYCLSNSEHAALRQEGSKHRCVDCPTTKCAHNPNKEGYEHHRYTG